MEILQSLGIDPAVMLAQAVNFFVLLGILTFLVYKPVLKLLDDRKQRVREAEEHAQLVEDKLARTEELTKKELHKAQLEAQRIIKNSQEEAKKREEEMLTSAKQKVEKVVEEGKNLIRRERDEASKEIQKEVGKIVLLATKKLIGREVNDKDQSKLVEEASKEIASI